MELIYVMFAQKLVSSLFGKSIFINRNTIFTFYTYYKRFLFFNSSAEREYVMQEDFMKAVRKVSDNKKLESKLDYKPV